MESIPLKAGFTFSPSGYNLKIRKPSQSCYFTNNQEKKRIFPLVFKKKKKLTNSAEFRTRLLHIFIEISNRYNIGKVSFNLDLKIKSILPLINK